jgi:hypothetical protein
MPVIDWTQSRLRWHNQIGFWSGWSKCVLRRSGSDRLCTACVTQFLPRERVGGLVNPEDMKARVSALMPDGVTLQIPEPDKERDRLIVFNPDGTEQAPYRIVVLPRRVEPEPGVTLFWTLQVRR